MSINCTLLQEKNEEHGGAMVALEYVLVWADRVLLPAMNGWVFACSRGWPVPGSQFIEVGRGNTRSGKNERGIGWVEEPHCYPNLFSTTAIKLFRPSRPTESLEQAKCGCISAFSRRVVFIRWNWWGEGKEIYLLPPSLSSCISREDNLVTKELKWTDTWMQTGWGFGVFCWTFPFVFELCAPGAERFAKPPLYCNKSFPFSSLENLNFTRISKLVINWDVSANLGAIRFCSRLESDV